MASHIVQLLSLATILSRAPASAATTAPKHCAWQHPASRLGSPGACPRPVDDVSAGSLGSWTPWTYAPLCVLPQHSTEGKWCLYSSAPFNFHRGLSLIVTPETGAALADAAQNPEHAWQGRHHLQPDSNGAELAYEIKALPGRGKSVLATRPIRRAEVFMVAFPAFIVDETFMSEATPAEGKRMFSRATKQVTDLATMTSLARSTGGDKLEDVLRTNSFGLAVGQRKHTGIFPEISRMNHGCDPNASARFVSSKLAMEAIATRDISPGEEITISYIPLGLPQEERAFTLSSVWSFECTCSLCSASKSERDASDARREKINKIGRLLNEAITVPRAIKLTAQLLDLVEEEHLEPKLGQYYHDLMKIFFELGDIESAVRFAERALRVVEEFGDPEDELGVALRANLKSLDTWRAQTAG